MIVNATSSALSALAGAANAPAETADRAIFRRLLTGLDETVAAATPDGPENGETVAPATVSNFAGVSEFGLMGWVMEQLRQKLEAEARAELMGEQGLDEDAIANMNYQEKQRFMAQVFDRTEEKMAQALKDGALEKLREREEKLYKLTPPEPTPHGDTGF